MPGFEDIHEFAITAGHLIDRLLPRDLLGTPIDQRLPEDRAAHGKADEPRHRGGGGQPLMHLVGVLAALSPNVDFESPLPRPPCAP